MAALPIPIGSNIGAFKELGEPKVVNAYAEATGADNKAPYTLLPCCGLIPLGDDVDGACRGMIWLDDDSKLYAVFGFYLYSVSSDGTKTQVAPVSGTGPVHIARNDAGVTQVIIVTNEGLIFSAVDGTVTLESYLDDDDNYIFTNEDGTDATVKGVTQVGGYFVYWINEGRFYVSALNSTTVTALDYATAESDPDALTKVHGRGNTAYMIGTRTIEVWAVSGAADFPLTRVQGAALNFGSSSPYSIQDFDKGVMLVASDNTVRFIQGYNDRVISNPEIARLIEAEPDKSALYAFTYTRGVNKFYCLQGYGWTREYNAATDKWHHRESGVGNQWKASFYARAFGSDIFGSRETGRTFQGSYSTFVEDSEPLLWGFDTSLYHSFPNGVSIEQMDLDVRTGNGPTSSVEGELMLELSKDNGRTFYLQKQAGLGKLGEYGKRVRFYGLGQCDHRGMMVRVRISDPVPRGIVSIDMQVSKVAL